MKIDGSCNCGTITIEGEADRATVTVCHCTDCQTSSGSAFRVAVPVKGDVFKVSGRPAIYIKTTAESGNRARRRSARPAAPRFTRPRPAKDSSRCTSCASGC